MFLRVFWLFTSLVLVACGDSNPTTAESILPSSESNCGGDTIDTDYIVKWKDGRISKVKYPNQEDLKTNFVEPNLKLIDKIEYDQRFTINTGEFRPRAINQINNWGYLDAGASSYWTSQHRGAGVVVAVIDSGVDVNHDKLKNQIAYNLGESGDLSNNGIDDDGNGYIDDYAGFNFLDQNSDLTDEVYHGTHVAGVIAAEHNNSIVENNVVLSMAPEAKIMPLKFLDQQGGTLSAAIAAIDYAVANGAHIINASWGGSGCSGILKERVSRLDQEGVLFVAASGNSGANLEIFPEFPAAFTGNMQLTVGSVTQHSGMSAFSNYSRNLVHLFAPGSHIASTVPGNEVMEMSGTSMAAPFVAGALALIWSANPQKSAFEVRETLLRSVANDTRYKNQTQGRLHLFGSMAQASH